MQYSRALLQRIIIEDVLSPILFDCGLWVKDLREEWGSDLKVQRFEDEFSWNYSVEGGVIINKMEPDMGVLLFRCSRDM